MFEKLFVIFLLLSASYASADILETDPPFDEPLRRTFGFSPICRFILPVIHVYDVEKGQFISGSSVKTFNPKLVNENVNWNDAGDKCPNSHTVTELENKFGFKLDTIQKYIVFFIDLHGAPPFKPVSESAVMRRDSLFKTFQALDEDEASRVWIHLPPIVIQ